MPTATWLLGRRSPAKRLATFAVMGLPLPLLPSRPTDPHPVPPASPQAIDKRRSAAERELHGSLRVLARHLPQEQYEALAEGLAVSCWPGGWPLARLVGLCRCSVAWRQAILHSPPPGLKHAGVCAFHPLHR